MRHDYLFEFRRADLDRLNLAAGVILSEPLAIPPELAAGLIIFKKRVERALLLPAKDQPDEWPPLLGSGTAAPLVLINPAGFLRTASPEDMVKVTAAIRTLEGHGLFVSDGYEAAGDGTSGDGRPRP
jgi:hypothetical protein